MEPEALALVEAEQARQIGQLMNNQTRLRAQLQLAEARAARAEAKAAALRQQLDEARQPGPETADGNQT